MSKLIDTVLEKYLSTYRDLIVTENVPGGFEESITLSFPMHLASSHRIEITVTPWGSGRCLISDSARTLGEIEASGFTLTDSTMQRLHRLAQGDGASFVDRHLILESANEDIGFKIQRFLELSKTIGDVYLVHEHREAQDRRIVMKVRALLDSLGYVYKLDEPVNGRHQDVFQAHAVRPEGSPKLPWKTGQRDILSQQVSGLNICPVCGYDSLPYPPEDHNICFCCGTEFGYEDCGVSHSQLRARWIRNGTIWRSVDFPPPPRWNAIEQLIKHFGSSAFKSAPGWIIVPVRPFTGG